MPPSPSLHPSPFLWSRHRIPEHSPASVRTTVTVQSSCSACRCCSWLLKLELPSQSSEQLNPGSIAHPQPSSSRTFGPARRMRVSFLKQEEAFATCWTSPCQQGIGKGSGSPRLSLPKAMPRTSRAGMASAHHPVSLRVSSVVRQVSLGGGSLQSVVAS